jgi:beta-glucosidase
MPMNRRFAFAGRLLASCAPLALIFTLSARADTPEARARDLVSQMTLEEKAAQMQDNAPAIPRLGLKRYGWWNEVLHGVARAGHATVFPQAIGMAATWDTDLMRSIGETISTEGRANYNAALKRDASGTDRYYGVNYWSPNINIFRDPRWGRGQETYGEDPYLTAHMAIPFIKGIQQQGKDGIFKGMATPKHFVVHSGPEPLRHGFNVDVSPFDFEDTYVPAFRAAIVDAGAYSLMCAYNAIDGYPACESPLMAGRLRKDWGFKGFVVTDCDSIDDMVTGHKKYVTAAAASAAGVKAGSDLDCGSTYKALPDAVRQGLLKESDMDVSLERLMVARIRMGLIDGSPYDAIPASELNSAPHRALALQAAEKAIVLLSNPKAILPLKGTERIAVIGPNAALLQSLEGNYTGSPVNPSLPLEALRKVFGTANVSYAAGAPLTEGMRMPVPETYLKPAADSKTLGLKGEYFDNTTFAGAPKFTRTDPLINFDFYRSAPEGLKPMGFSVRWSGVITPPVAGTYKLGFRMQARAGQPAPDVKVWVDGKLVVTPELSQAAGTDAVYCGGACAKPPMAPVSLTFADTKAHDIRIDYVRATEDRASSLDWIAPSEPLIDAAVKAANDADTVIAFVGLSPDLEGEEMAVSFTGFTGGDRTSLTLPEAQLKMLKAVKATGKKLIIVYLTGGPISDPWVETNADALVQAWYPGEAGGEAIARVLTGKTSPAGRLPYTLYRDTADLPAFENYSMQGRTYRYFKGEVLHPFGYGLSYTTFAYARPALSAPTIKAGKTVTASVTVRNAGTRDSDEVVQLYLKKPDDRANPVLAGFKRIHLKAGQVRTLSLPLDARAMSQVDADGVRKVVPGTYMISFGGGQPNYAATVSTLLKVTGEAVLAK